MAPTTISRTSLPFDHMARLASRATAVSVAFVFVEDGRTARLRGVHAGNSTAGADFVVQSGLCGEVVSRGLPVLIDDLSSRFDSPGEGEDLPQFAAFAGVPIRQPSGFITGAICVLSAEPRQWNDEDSAALEAVAAATAAELALQDESTSAVRADAARDRSEAKFRAIFDNTAMGIALVGGDGWLIRTNRTMQRMFGESEEELRGRRLLDFSHPEDAAEALKALGRLASGEDGYLEFETRFLLDDGRTIWARVIASVVLDRQNRPLCGIAMVDDITQRKAAEEALQESQQRLLLAQRMEAVGRLAGGIAHDFNNLLTAIASFAQLLQLETEPGGEADLYVGEIQKASLRATKLTRQLLAFSRQQVLRTQSLSLNQIVWNLEGILGRLIGEHLELHTELDPILPHVLADPGQVEQVLMNLVVNARDAMQDGGRITIRTRATELTEEDQAKFHYEIQPGRYGCIAVVDEGVGMSEETLARMFEPFFTTKEQGKGTGLGLATAYGIVKQSGGYIWATSQVGRGTEFEVLLPVTTEELPTAPEKQLSRKRVKGGTETLLLVEDEKTIRTLAERILRRHGYQVLTAANGEEALRLAEMHLDDIDLLITDVIMPGMNGRVLAQQLQSRRPGLPLLYMSGYTADVIRQYGVFDTGTAFLDKPFTPDVLADSVRSVLDQAQA